jgi:hypothetical protein
MGYVKMRAKMYVTAVLDADEQNGWNERLVMCCVAAKRYGEDCLDEDNTFAKFTPGGVLDIQIANAALRGKFKTGDTFYVDFTPVE